MLRDNSQHGDKQRWFNAHQREKKELVLIGTLEVEIVYLLLRNASAFFKLNLSLSTPEVISISLE